MLEEAEKSKMKRKGKSQEKESSYSCESFGLNDIQIFLPEESLQIWQEKKLFCTVTQESIVLFHTVFSLIQKVCMQRRWSGFVFHVNTAERE